MAVTIRASATYASAATETSSTVTLPSGWQPGDLCYIGWELTATSGTVTTPSGWTAVVAGFAAAGVTNAHSGVLRRVLQAGDTGPAISHTSGRFAAISAALTGMDAVTTEDVTPTTDDNTGVTTPSVRAPSITPVTDNCLLLTWHAVRNGTNGVSTAFTPDASETEQADVSSAVAAISNAAIELAFLQLGTAGATGTKTATATGTNVSSINMMGTAIAVRPAASALAFVPLQPVRRVPYRVEEFAPERRFRQLLPPPDQVFQFAETTQRREMWPRALVRRSRVTLVVPNQVNPPYPVSEIRQWRQPRGLWPRRGHGFMPVPAQQAAAPPPPFVWQPLRHPRLAGFARRGRVLPPVPPQLNPPYPFTELVQRRQAWPRALTRRGRVAWPPQAQAPAAPPVWVQPHRAPLRALALIRRRFAQLMPWPQATLPPFAVARSTPTVTDPRDGTATTAAAVTSAPTAAAGVTSASTATAGVTSTPTVTDPRDGTAGVT